MPSPTDPSRSLNGTTDEATSNLPVETPIQVTITIRPRRTARVAFLVAGAAVALTGLGFALNAVRTMVAEQRSARLVCSGIARHIVDARNAAGQVKRGSGNLVSAPADARMDWLEALSELREAAREYESAVSLGGRTGAKVAQWRDSIAGVFATWGFVASSFTAFDVFWTKEGAASSNDPSVWLADQRWALARESIVHATVDSSLRVRRMFRKVMDDGVSSAMFSVNVVLRQREWGQARENSLFLRSSRAVVAKLNLMLPTYRALYGQEALDDFLVGHGFRRGLQQLYVP